MPSGPKAMRPPLWFRARAMPSKTTSGAPRRVRTVVSRHPHPHDAVVLRRAVIRVEPRVAAVLPDGEAVQPGFAAGHDVRHDARLPQRPLSGQFEHPSVVALTDQRRRPPAAEPPTTGRRARMRASRAIRSGATSPARCSAPGLGSALGSALGEADDEGEADGGTASPGAPDVQAERATADAAASARNPRRARAGTKATPRPPRPRGRRCRSSSSPASPARRGASGRGPGRGSARPADRARSATRDPSGP